ncbi:MAG TPA: asparagine synthase (glutamine-hydrolyzing) [Gaiellaceae bacterium]|nr:asparagine synthase (glutamine-hydrolyzing) [Gaiellaceae bacterium]
MCGICGAVQLAGRPREPLPEAALTRMTDALEHRGPDERGLYLAPGIALGVRRLAIVDPRDGQQPVASEDGTVVAVQNGELYNHLELRRELAGHRFASRCDTEVLPHLYEEAGAALPRRLRGMFALAVWDARERRLLLARDRLGVKPLYTARVGDLLLFASELKGLLASGLVPDALDPEAIDAYLSFGFVPEPATPLAAVRKLRAGELLVAGPDGVRHERYWRYPLPAPDERPPADEEYGEQLRLRLEEAVRLRLMSDVPLGAMLSGGLDSSLVVALTARQAPGALRTFSVGFREAGRANELADARRVASLYGCEHHEVELSFDDADVSLEQLVWALDEPLADLSALGLLALSALASRHVTVALSGQGADELFGGYQRHRTAVLAARLRRRVPHPLLAAAARAAGGGRRGRAARVLAAQGAAAQWAAAHARLDSRERARLVRRPLAGGGANAVERAAEGLGCDGPAALLYLDGRLGLPDDMLHYFDRASMAHSLEVRVPFLDHELVEWAARLPLRLKVDSRTTKVLLKRVARALLPDEIVDKPKLGFFDPVAAAWLRAQLDGALPEHLLDPGARSAGLVERREVERRLLAYRAGRGDGNVLLALLMLEVWLSSYLPRATRAAAPEPKAEAVA